MHPDGILFDKYGFIVIYDARSQIDAKLSSVIRGRDWNCLHARSEALVAIQIHLSFVKFGVSDTPLWLPSKNFRYSSRDILGTVYG